MIEVYSNNVAVTQNQVIPLNNTTIHKGCTATVSNSTVNLNANGVYMISANAVGTSATTGDVTVQMFKDGVAVPQAISTDTIATADDLCALGFTTLVCVHNNNCNCCGGSTAITFVNTGIANTIDLNVVVTKVC